MFQLASAARPTTLATMARGLRIQYPGVVYQGLNRVDWPEDIFVDDKELQLFSGRSSNYDQCSRVSIAAEEPGGVR